MGYILCVYCYCPGFRWSILVDIIICCFVLDTNTALHRLVESLAFVKWWCPVLWKCASKLSKYFEFSVYNFLKLFISATKKSCKNRESAKMKNWLCHTYLRIFIRFTILLIGVYICCIFNSLTFLLPYYYCEAFVFHYLIVFLQFGVWLLQTGAYQ